MSRKRTTYTAEFKAKLVLEGTKILNEIATQYVLLPKNLLNCRATCKFNQATKSISPKLNFLTF